MVGVVEALASFPAWEAVTETAIRRRSGICAGTSNGCNRKDVGQSGVPRLSSQFQVKRNLRRRAESRRAPQSLRSVPRRRWVVRCRRCSLSASLAGRESAARQLFTLMLAGFDSWNVSGVSGRSLRSRFAVMSATVVPAAAPTGPPIAAPIPPPAKAPIRTPPPAPPPIHSRWCFMWL